VSKRAQSPQLMRGPLGGAVPRRQSLVLKKKETHMAKTFTCRDVGVNCDWKARGNDEAEIMRKIKDHARAVHKMDPIPSDLEPKVRAAVRDEG
jgi:predicted small metal-binding protein